MEVPLVHSSSLASDLVSASEAESVGASGAASEDSSEVAPVDIPEVALVSTSEAGVPPGEATLMVTDEHQDPYPHSRSERE